MANDSGAVTIVPLADLMADDATQWRVKNSSKAIEDMAEHLRGGGVLPPIDVFVDRDGKKRVGDGHHRIGAYRSAGMDQIPARLHKGDADAAFLFGVRIGVGNKSVRARREDIRRAALELMRRPGIRMSDVSIAELLCTPRPTISLWHRKWAEEGSLAKLASRVGLDGRAINTANIGKGTSQRPESKTQDSSPSNSRQPELPGASPTRARSRGPGSGGLFEDPNSDISDDDLEIIQEAATASNCRDAQRDESSGALSTPLDEQTTSARIMSRCDAFSRDIEALFRVSNPRKMRNDILKKGCEDALLLVVKALAEGLPPDSEANPDRWRPRIISGGKS
jgi:hypothetical protein